MRARDARQIRIAKIDKNLNRECKTYAPTHERRWVHPETSVQDTFQLCISIYALECARPLLHLIAFSRKGRCCASLHESTINGSWARKCPR